MSDSEPKRQYTDDEARAIFERALATESTSSLAHEDLVAAAAEVGISREAVERAVTEVEAQQAEQTAKAAILSRRRRGFFNHLVVYLAVNGFLFLVNWLTSPGAWWVLFPVVAWGLGLFFHAWSALSRQVSPRAIRRQLARAQGRSRRSPRKVLQEDEHARRRQRHERIEESAKQLGEAVEEGVAALLGKLATELRQVDAPRTRVKVEAAQPAASAEPEAEPEARQRTPERIRTR